MNLNANLLEWIRCFSSAQSLHHTLVHFLDQHRHCGASKKLLQICTISKKNLPVLGRQWRHGNSVKILYSDTQMSALLQIKKFHIVFCTIVTCQSISATRSPLSLSMRTLPECKSDHLMNFFGMNYVADRTSINQDWPESHFSVKLGVGKRRINGGHNGINLLHQRSRFLRWINACHALEHASERLNATFHFASFCHWMQYR